MKIKFICLFFTFILTFSVSLMSISAAASEPVITKNPTSEAIAIGGKTWFIAHANNATSMTWELVDPNGYIHSLSEAMSMNPGLNLQALEGDTIAVSNVPQSVNGWGVQATFYGSGSSVSTSPAYIYVGDFLNAYSSMIEKYRRAKIAGVSNYGDSADYNVSEWLTSTQHVGYALKDLDKNGIPELIISGINDKPYEVGPVVFEICTLVNNQPKTLLASQGRFWYYLMTDNRIYSEAFGGASHTYFETYKIVGDHVEFQEGFYTTTFDLNGKVAYRVDHSGKRLDLGDVLLPGGDYENPDYTFVVENYDDLFVFREQCWIPQLTLIA